ncbi:MAG TPA: cation diffusion facilitator family transporter [Oligoflexia bacterium]|nr:cation diffusion facilitator family transporter [bacterium]HMQ11357.1 cation diffusion facilitator family transporter [Oligoflexia bacterium]HMR24077.1 cation diffusion facilitator family transporter [Oligoflexia bacterium]
MAHIHDYEIQSKKLYIAIGINILLTIAQIVGGLISGSLSLLADALHNFSDAGAILVAVIARKIGQTPPSPTMTYGYQRAETLGTLINSVSLILVGFYLMYESISRYTSPQTIDGWIVIWVAGIALVIDIATALLTHSAGAKYNMNIRAAFIHNISDALASVVVIIAGILIIYYQWNIVDLLATIGISLYVIFHGGVLTKKAILILMQATPDGININEIKDRLEKVEGVKRVFHIHVWQLDDHRICFEGHIELDEASNVRNVKKTLKEILRTQFHIEHSTIDAEMI